MHGTVDPITIRTGFSGSYDVYFTSMKELSQLMKGHFATPGRCIVITDANVGSFWLDTLLPALEGWQPHVMVLDAGETTKSALMLQRIYDEVLSLGIDRRTPILALGGGVIGDLAGYAAATLLRGLPLVHVPTSMIAQVDSAIGGKTGINHAVGKNLIGAFYPPRIICADPATLLTLPALEFNSGLAEVVKHALITDIEFFNFLEEFWPKVIGREKDVLTRMVAWAASIKAKVVEEDTLEQGRRAILNFGHTFGHAIERVAGYGSFTHGEAVALGMRAALTLSKRKHTFLDIDRPLNLVKKIPVRERLPSLLIKKDELIEAMRFDKKSYGGRIRVILLDRVGNAYVTDDITRDDLKHAWGALYLEEA